MRIVRDPAIFHEELHTASDEAEKAFGDGKMMVEKLVERPRHIEVQLLADQHGNVACLFERECSLQRRHQKLLEEAPSPYLSDHPKMWKEMCEASRRLAKASGYVGAGTVEFMVDEAEGKFYFLEVNTRLQVEHPVTEFVSGVDLVKWQLRIASGEKLTLASSLMAGDRKAICGHSMEVRIVAEDPAKGFMPSIGTILGWAEPEGPGIRVDTGFGVNAEVTRFYDSLIAKVICHSDSRQGVIQRMRFALLDFHILGVTTNIGFMLDVLDHPDFGLGQIDTGFLGREFAEWGQAELPPELGSIVSVAEHTASRHVSATNVRSVWDEADGFRNEG